MLSMYHPVDIQKLSQAQVSRILNSHPVRVKVGNGMKMMVSKEHAKKLHKSHMKGCGMNITLDPYAIAQNQHLRQAVGMFGKGQVSEGLKQTTGQAATDLINASTARAIQGITGNGMRKMRGKGQVSEGLKQTTGQAATDLINASTARAIQGITGNGMHGKGGLKTFKKTMSAVGDVLGLNSGVSQAVKQQLLRSVGQAGAQMIQQQVPGSEFEPQAMSKGETRRMNRQYGQQGQPDFYSPQFDSMPAKTRSQPIIAEPVPEATVVESMDLPYQLPLPPGVQGKLYASGLKKPKRVMSQAQKDALAKGRHALRIKLEQMGAGTKHKKRGGALMPAGY